MHSLLGWDLAAVSDKDPADLESEDLLTRTRDARDGREHILKPTAKAVALMRGGRQATRRHMRETMQRALTPVEIELLFVAAKAMNKLADAWSKPHKARTKAETKEEEPVV